MMHIDTQAKY